MDTASSTTFDRFVITLSIQVLMILLNFLMNLMN